MPPKDRTDEFVQLLTRHQGRIRAYVLTLLPDRAEAEDVLQEANLVLWRKREEWDGENEFAAWACKVAYYEVLGFLRDKARDRHRFDDELVATIDEAAQQHVQSIDDRREALQSCLKKLSPAHRNLLEDRYAAGHSVKSIASHLGKTVNAVSRALYSLRKALMTCIQKQISEHRA